MEFRLNSGQAITTRILGFKNFPEGQLICRHGTHDWEKVHVNSVYLLNNRMFHALLRKGYIFRTSHMIGDDLFPPNWVLFTVSFC